MRPSIRRRFPAGPARRPCSRTWARSTSHPQRCDRGRPSSSLAADGSCLAHPACRVWDGRHERREAAMGGDVGRAEIDVAAPRRVVWEVLTSNGARPEIMFGAEVVSDWRLGSQIAWRGEWQGKSFEDHGRVIELEDRQEPWRIVLTHFSPLSGLPDAPENYHTLRFELDEVPAGTRDTPHHDKNPPPQAPPPPPQKTAHTPERGKTGGERG